MTRASKTLRPTYGRRGAKLGPDAGIRRLAPTFGKARFLTHSLKAGGEFLVESEAERVVAHLLSLDPRVRSFKPQPFAVDLIEGRILRTPEAVAEARNRNRGRSGPKFYTPDFAVEWHEHARSVIEVKLQGYEGDAEYRSRLELALPILEGSGYAFAQAMVPADPRWALRANVGLLTRAVARIDLAPTPDEVARIERLLGHDESSMGALCSALSLSPSRVPLLLAYGVVRGDVRCQPINASMTLSLALGDLSHLEVLEEVLR